MKNTNFLTRQAKPSQAKPSQAKPSHRLSAFFRDLMAALGLVAVVSTIAACGGGGSSATVANGAAVASGAPLPGGVPPGGVPATSPATLSSISPIAGTTNVDPETFTGVVVSATGKLDASSLTTTNITVKAGASNYSGAVTVAGDGKSFTVATSTIAIGFTGAVRPAVKLEYGKTYTVSVNAKDASGNAFVVVSTFSTKSPVVCVAPAMANSKNVCMSPPVPAGYTWNTNMKAWVADIGVLVSGANTLPAACVAFGDACWLDAIANGAVKLSASDAIATGLNTRPVVFGFFVAGSGSFPGFYNVVPLYADAADGEASFLNQSVGNGSQGNTITEMKGSTLGAKQTIPAFGCFERVYLGIGWGNNTIACPI